MSDNNQYLDVDDDEFFDAPKALRDAYKKLVGQHKNVLSENGSLKGQLAAQAIGEVLSDKGFKNPKRVERDLISDGIDPLDKGAVEKWLSDNGDDYARGEVKPAEETPVVSEEEQQAHTQLGLGDGYKAPGDLTKVDAARAEIPADADGATVLQYLQKHGL